MPAGELVGSKAAIPGSRSEAGRTESDFVRNQEGFFAASETPTGTPGFICIKT
jgi:hypothetical protein